jgi:hypothetical protein
MQGHEWRRRESVAKAIETNPQGLNPRKGSGVIKVNPLGNGY